MNWKGPSTQYTLAVMMCTTTGTGEAKNRALSGVMRAPTANVATSSAPALTGTTLMRTRLVGTSQRDLSGEFTSEAMNR